MDRLTIIQHNVGNSNAKATRPLYDSLIYPTLLAIQEPAYNKLTRSTYCPRLYELAYEAQPGTKVCFMIRKDQGIIWRRHQYGPNVAALRMRMAGETLTVVNVYSPRCTGERIQAAGRLNEALEAVEGRVLVVGDFNTHHPAWGGIGTTRETQAENLLANTRAKGLSLCTPAGEATWARGLRRTVIDLTFASEALAGRILYCGPQDHWAVIQDHIPIRIEIDWSGGEVEEPRTTKFAIRSLDHEALRDETRRTLVEGETLATLQDKLRAALAKACPTAKPSRKARHEWSLAVRDLLRRTRDARRRVLAYGRRHDRQSLKELTNQLTRELRRNSRDNWRRAIRDITDDKGGGPQPGLWRLAKWARAIAGEAHQDRGLPALRRNEQESSLSDDDHKVEVLREKFFPTPTEADLSDIADETPAERIQIAREVSVEEVTAIVNHLPRGKAPGPDGIPNEAIQAIIPDVAASLAHAMNRCLAEEVIPPVLKESTTIVLRKPGKKDYTLPGSYRPIALENTLAKVLEKALANRLRDAAEEHNLLPWTQMGARPGRSTLTAIGLLTTCVETAWRTKPGSVVSMLSLDLKGAFDNVSHIRLLAILRGKGLPDWLVNTIRSFLQGRRTRIAYPGYESDWIQTETGIPQGSPLSPILFLFYVSELLEKVQTPENGLLGFGFVDDTNLVAWGPSAEHNCRILTAAHSQCEEWARRHGAVFAPEKYQLIHFTRRKRHNRDDLASTVRIGHHEVSPQAQAIKVLGIWLDPRLNWREQAEQATRKGDAAVAALRRITASGWGPPAKSSRILYTSIVRPAMLYGTQEWALGSAGDSQPKSMLTKLELVQNRALRLITGGYRRTARATLEREAGVPPLPLAVQAGAMARSLSKGSITVEAKITEVAEHVYRRLNAGRSGPRAPTRREHVRVKAAGLPGSETHAPTTRAKRWLQDRWKERWEAAAADHRPRGAATWNTPWEQRPQTLYARLTKAEATALFLMRSNVLGLNAWLAAIGVPDVSPRCPCGWHAQTVRHVLLHCPRMERGELLRQCDSTRFHDILTRPTCVPYAARWLVRSGLLGQFSAVKEAIEEEEEGGLGDYRPFEEVAPSL